MDQITLTHLRTYISWLPRISFNEFQYSEGGKGTITLGQDRILFSYISQFSTRILSKELLYTDVTAYFRPFPTILYLDHQNKRLPSIVKVGDTLREEVQVAEVDKFVKILESHHIPARTKALSTQGRLGKLYGVFAMVILIAIGIIIWLSFISP